MKLLTLSTALLLATFAPGFVQATSYVDVVDRALFDQAPVIALVGVLSVEPAPAQGVPSTDYIVLVERLLKGKIAGSTVVVRVAGGVGPDGWGLEIVGAPRFAAGDRAILFLLPRHDGTYGILHMMLGAFHEVTLGEQHLALRELQEVRLLGGDESKRRPSTGLPRDFRRFADWLASGAKADGTYRVSVPTRHLEAWREAFAHVRRDRRRLRWFGGEIEWQLDRQAPTGSRRLLKEALRAWNPLAGLHLVYGGTTEADTSLALFDGLNVVSFGDAEQIIPGTFSCRLGGVVALGGPWFDPEVTDQASPGAGSAATVRILGADIVFNDRTDCLLDELSDLSGEALMHELGHTLGLDFACGDSPTGPCGTAADASVMRAFLHTDRKLHGPSDRDRDALRSRD
jgi:hypothetical protein